MAYKKNQQSPLFIAILALGAILIIYLFIANNNKDKDSDMEDSTIVFQYKVFTKTGETDCGILISTDSCDNDGTLCNLIVEGCELFGQCPPPSINCPKELPTLTKSQLESRIGKTVCVVEYGTKASPSPSDDLLFMHRCSEFP